MERIDYTPEMLDQYASIYLKITVTSGTNDTWKKAEG